MTVAGTQGDEYLNMKDMREWVHDGTAWQERPFMPRLVGFAHGSPPSDQRYQGRNWQHVGWTECAFTKLRDDTLLLVEGHFGAYAVAAGAKMFVAPHVKDSQSWPDIPAASDPNSDEYGIVYTFDGVSHAQFPFSMLYPRHRPVPKGTYTMHLVIAVQSGTIGRDQFDQAATRVWEIAP